MSLPRVCHVSTVHRGVEIRIIRKELASLAAAGHDAHAIIAATPAEVEEAAGLGVTIHALPDRAGAGRLSRMTRKMYEAWRLCRQVDASIYHTHDPELIPLALLLKAFGYKVVMDVHEDLANQILTKAWIPRRLRPLVSRLARMAERIGARFLDAVVTVTPLQNPFFEDVAKRIVVLYNYPLLSELPDSAAPAQESAGQDQPPAAKRTHVAYIGGVSRIRGINEAVQAVALADVRLILAGKFKTDAERQEAAALPGWARVEELGWVDRHGVSDALQRSFAGLCTLHPTPNHVIALPIKMFEYMAAGIPSIISDIPGWLPYMEKHDAGIAVDPMDPQAIANAITFLRDNPARAAEMGNNGRQAVLEHYNWDTQGRKLVRLYQEILAA